MLLIQQQACIPFTLHMHQAPQHHAENKYMYPLQLQQQTAPEECSGCEGKIRTKQYTPWCGNPCSLTR